MNTLPSRYFVFSAIGLLSVAQATLRLNRGLTFANFACFDVTTNAKVAVTNTASNNIAIIFFTFSPQDLYLISYINKF